MKKTITHLLLLFIALSGKAQNFVTDSLFGDIGQVSTNQLDGENGLSANILRQPDGKFLLTGYFYDANTNNYFNLMFRTDECGQIDSSFGTDGVVQHKFERVTQGVDYLLQPDGKIVVAGRQGNSTIQTTLQYPSISRYNSDGSVDSTFGINGTRKFTSSGNPRLESIHRLSDGKFLCTNAIFMVRFDSTGAVDPTFGINYHTPPTFYTTINRSTSIMRSDGKIITVAAGYYTPFSTDVLLMMSYDGNGELDTSFGTLGFQTDENFQMDWEQTPLMALQSDDKIIAAMKNMDGDKIIVARYNANGPLDSTFGTNGYTEIPISITASTMKLDLLTLLNDDSFIVGVANQEVSTGWESQLLKFSSNGIPDPTFSVNGGNLIEFNNPVSGRADISYATPDGEIILGTCSPGIGSVFMALTKITSSPSMPHITQTGNILNSNVSNPNCTFEWFLGGNVISGETSSTLSTSVDGIYTVTVTNSLGCTESADFSVINTGINNQLGSSTTLNVYPNPATSTIHITWSGNDNSTIELIDLTGRVVMVQSAALKNQADINIEQFAKGVYILKVSSNSSSSTTRVTIN